MEWMKYYEGDRRKRCISLQPWSCRQGACVAAV